MRASQAARDRRAARVWRAPGPRPRCTPAGCPGPGAELATQLDQARLAQLDIWATRIGDAVGVEQQRLAVAARLWSRGSRPGRARPAACQGGRSSRPGHRDRSAAVGDARRARPSAVSLRPCGVRRRGTRCKGRPRGADGAARGAVSRASQWAIDRSSRRRATYGARARSLPRRVDPCRRRRRSRASSDPARSRRRRRSRRRLR